MKTLEKITEGINNYFLGKRIRRLYEAERSFYREYVLQPNRLKTFLKDSEIQERIDLFFARDFPNFIELASIASSIYTENIFNAVAGVSIAEYLRIIFKEAAEYNVKWRKKMMKAVSKEEEKKEEFEKYLDS